MIIYMYLEELKRFWRINFLNIFDQLTIISKCYWKLDIFKVVL